MPLLKNNSRRIFVIALFAAFCFLPRPGNAQEKVQPGEVSRSDRKDLAKQREANKKMADRTHFQYFVIRAENQTYGYDIYADGNLYIHQSTIPGLSGLDGFNDTIAAGKIARLVIQKIKNGELPPTINISDLKKMKVIKK